MHTKSKFNWTMFDCVILASIYVFIYCLHLLACLLGYCQLSLENSIVILSCSHHSINSFVELMLVNIWYVCAITITENDEANDNVYTNDDDDDDNYNDINFNTLWFNNHNNKVTASR